MKFDPTQFWDAFTNGRIMILEDLSVKNNTVYLDADPPRDETFRDEWPALHALSPPS